MNQIIKAQLSKWYKYLITYCIRVCCLEIFQCSRIKFDFQLYLYTRAEYVVKTSGFIKKKLENQ